MWLCVSFQSLGVSAEWLGDLNLLLCGCAEFGRFFSRFRASECVRSRVWLCLLQFVFFFQSLGVSAEWLGDLKLLLGGQLLQRADDPATIELAQVSISI